MVVPIGSGRSVCIYHRWTGSSLTAGTVMLMVFSTKRWKAGVLANNRRPKSGDGEDNGCLWGKGGADGIPRLRSEIYTYNGTIGVGGYSWLSDSP